MRIIAIIVGAAIALAGLAAAVTGDVGRFGLWIFVGGLAAAGVAGLASQFRDTRVNAS